MVKLLERLGDTLRAVTVSHDEIQMEAPPEHARDYGALAVECTREAGTEPGR